MKKVLIAIAAAGMIAGLGACSKKNDTPANSAQVMFVNGCGGTTALTAKSGGTQAATNLTFPTTSGYQNVTAGTSVTVSYLLQDGTPLTSGSASFTANTHYSVFAGGTITSSYTVFATDDLTAPTGTNARIRFVNLTTDVASFDFYLNTVKMDSGVAQKSCTSFMDIPATTAGKVVLTSSANPSISASLASYTFSAGKLYTVMLTGSSIATIGTSVLTATVINNN